MGNDSGTENDSFIQIVPDFSKFLFDVLSDLAVCGTTKGIIINVFHVKDSLYNSTCKYW